MKNILKILEEKKQASLMLKHFKNRLESLEENFNAIFVAFQKDADQDEIKKLVHQLYWYYDMESKTISELTGFPTKKIFKLAGPIFENATCSSCSKNFVFEMRSKNTKPAKTCKQCQYDNYHITRAKVLTHFMGTNMPQDYDKYLHGKHWKSMRKKALTHADYQCQLCSSKDSVLEVHHNNYDSLGDEKLKDLLVLCRPCHRKFHTKK